MSSKIAAHVNAYVMNARFALNSLADDADRMTTPKKRARNNYTSLYTPIVDTKDYTIKRGELLWMRNGPGLHPLLNERQQPSVRSVLNGVTVINKGMGDIKKALEKEIRVLGTSRKDVVFDSGNLRKPPSDDPVIVLAGVQPLYNTGKYTIRPGDAVEWYFVDDDHRHQINDGVTSFTATRFSLGLRPLEISCSVRETMDEDPAFKLIWTKFVDHCNFGLDPADPIFDALFRSIQVPIVDAYANHAGISTTGAGRGRRLDMMISSPFSIIKMKEISKPVVPSSAVQSSDGDESDEEEEVTNVTNNSNPTQQLAWNNKSENIPENDNARILSSFTRRNPSMEEIKLIPAAKARKVNYETAFNAFTVGDDLKDLLKLAKKNDFEKWPVNTSLLFPPWSYFQFRDGKYSPMLDRTSMEYSMKRAYDVLNVKGESVDHKNDASVVVGDIIKYLNLARFDTEDENFKRLYTFYKLSEVYIIFAREAKDNNNLVSWVDIDALDIAYQIYN
jgi:hypothetical protein